MRRIAFVVSLLSLNVKCSDLPTVIDNYTTEIEQSRKGDNPTDKQTHGTKAKEYAEILLGLVKGINFKSYDKIKMFCNLLDKKVMEMSRGIPADEQGSVKIKRDISNYTEVSKFLKASSKLLDAIYENPAIINLIMEKTPKSVTLIGNEIVAMLRVLELIIADPNDIILPVEKMREFATSSEDGTRLLSQLVSVALENPDNINYINLLSVTDFSNKNLYKYLKIR